MRVILAVLSVLAVTTVAAQVQMRPTDAPLVNAANESWFQVREPIQYAGDVYYPAGSAVFFNGNVMVRTGHYNGVPLYADTTLEPYSIVFVPIGRGQLQPYERRRQGDLAGTTGSRAPSFPVARAPEVTSFATAAAAPTALPASIGAIGVYSPEPAVAIAGRPIVEPAVAVAAAPPASMAVSTIVRPQTNDGFWVQYSGATWVSAGRGVTPTAAFERVGEHSGFPVLRNRDQADDVIYLPTRTDLVAPYRKKTS